jgi:hypothetical protein
VCVIVIPSQHTGTIGFSESERYLGELCERTFLSLWSHPNLFKKQNKELSDLVVVFGDDIIFFSDKSCEYKAGVNAWSRWYRRAVQDSAHQLHQAARWVRSYPGEIYMDARCERPFPLQLPRVPNIHLVAIATGAREALEQNSGGGLRIRSNATSDDHFTIGDLDPSKDLVHVFDDVSLRLVFSELDTTSDFIAYLTRRASFLRGGRVVHAKDERNLLAHYLTNTDEHGAHNFVVPRDTRATNVVAENNWDAFVASAPYRRKKAADVDSYLWDRMITQLAEHADRGTLHTGQEAGLLGIEQTLRALAEENRFSRRMLVESLLGVRRAAVGDVENVRRRTVFGRDDGRRAHLFLCLKREGRDEGEYRELRQGLLRTHTSIAKLRKPELEAVVGIGVSPADDPIEAVDIVVRSFADWTEADRVEAERMRSLLGWVLDTARLETHSRVHEYPDEPSPISGREMVYRKESAGPASQPQRKKSVSRDKRKAQRAARKRNRR